MRSRVAENAMEMARIPEHPQFALSSADGRTNFRRHLVNASTVAAFMLFGLLFGFERSALAAGEPGAGERREEAVEAGSDLLTPKHDSFTGSDAVQSQLGDDREAKKNLLGLALLEDWQTAKNAVYDRIGLRFGFDYNALGYVATDSPGDEGTASGVFRAYGSWEFFGRETKDPSGLIYKLEHRHRYTKVPPRDFARELGYVGDINVAFNRQEFRITHLHWRQSLFRQRLIV